MTDHDLIAPACVASVGETVQCCREFHSKNLVTLAEALGAK